MGKSEEMSQVIIAMLGSTQIMEIMWMRIAE